MADDERRILRSFLIGIAIGAVTSEVWTRRQLRGWVNAIERGDYDDAQKHLRRWYVAFPQWFFGRPPHDESSADDGPPAEDA